MKFGGWVVNPVVGSYPQKVATALGELGETLVGAAYEPIAYLGSQLVSGSTNHAVLALQTIVAGKDVKNIVVMKFNEKGMDCTLYAIEQLVENGGELGGYKFDPKTGKDMPEDALKVFHDVMSGWVGVNVTPIAYLGTKMVKGANVMFLAKVVDVYPGAEPTVKLVVANSLMHTLDFEDVL